MVLAARGFFYNWEPLYKQIKILSANQQRIFHNEPIKSTKIWAATQSYSDISHDSNSHDLSSEGRLSITILSEICFLHRDF